MNLPVLRATIAEAVGRKVVLWGLIASAAFLTLFAVAFYFLFREVSSYEVNDALETALFGGVLTILGLYVASFLSSFLALTLASSSVSAEIDSGVTQAVVVRPLNRRNWYLQRWAGLALMSVAYVILIGGSLLLLARIISEYRPASAFALLGLMAAQAVFLITIGMLASTRLSTMATGVLMFSYFGLSWLGGFVSFIGSVAQRDSLVTTGTAVALIAPSDGIWKAASSYAVPANINLATFGDEIQMPFASFTQPAPAYVAWVVVFTVVALGVGVFSFSRRDL